MFGWGAEEFPVFPLNPFCSPLLPPGALRLCVPVGELDVLSELEIDEVKAGAGV